MLYIMTGIPASGKSTFCKQIFSNSPHIKIVSRDEIRFKILGDTDEYFAREKDVFSKFAAEIACYLNQEYDVVADATHLNYESRKKLINAVWETRFFDKPIDVIFINCSAELNEILRRNSLRGGRAKVPEVAIKEMANRYKPVERIETYGHANVKGVWNNW